MASIFPTVRLTKILVYVLLCSLEFGLCTLPVQSQNLDLSADEWLEDLDYLCRYFPARDRSLSNTKTYWYRPKGSIELHYLQAEDRLEDFYQAADSLRQETPHLSSNEIIVRLARLVAIGNNAHSRMYLLRNRTWLPSFGIRLYWFADGLYVIRTRPGLRRALGARILRINGHPVEEVRKKVDLLYGGNASWKKYKSLYYMNSPAILNGLGLIEGDDNATFELENTSGNRFSMSIPVLPLVRSKIPREANRELSPVHQSTPGGWLSLLPGNRNALPLYLRHPEKPFWDTLLQGRVLYLQHNRVSEGESPTFETFSRQIVAKVASGQAEYLVADLRLNTGGDLSLTLPFFRQLHQQKEKLKAVWVITSYSTFSAAITTAVLYKQMLDAKLVGEEVGDFLRNWSEGGRFFLPNSGLEIKYADGFHDLTLAPPPDLLRLMEETDFYEAFKERVLSPQHLTIDHPLSPAFSDYLSGRDPALDWIRTQISP